jgi:hypothetical protein
VDYSAKLVRLEHLKKIVEQYLAKTDADGKHDGGSTTRSARCTAK